MCDTAWNERHWHTYPQAQGSPSPTPPSCPHMPPPHLKDAVHISGLFALALRLLDVQTCLLRHLGVEREGNSLYVSSELKLCNTRCWLLYRATIKRYTRTCSGTSCSGGGPAGPPAVSRLALRGRI